MATFDSCIEELLEICEQLPGFAAVQRAVLVRDIRGRLRLVIRSEQVVDAGDLERALKARIGGWFVGPVLSTMSGDAAERRLAVGLCDQAKAWPPEWPTVWGRDQRPLDVTRWRGEQRVLGKQSWFGAASDPKKRVPLGQGAGVVAFYSFKGGVGRTTVLAMVAVALSRQGKKVVCIDLDLEAPGLSSYFDVSPEPSVLDFLLSHAATGRPPEEDPVQWTDVHGQQIGVVAAGRLDNFYLEKLARLDYLGATTAALSPVEQALYVLLKRIDARHHPDVILLDCRAGLHDLGGLSLTDLAHVDVLVGRDTPQNHAGLELALQVIARRRRPEEHRICVVQTFVAPPLSGEPARYSIERMRGKLYDACKSSLYRDLEIAPTEQDRAAPHAALPVEENNVIASAQTVQDIDDVVFGYSSIISIVNEVLRLLKREVADEA